MADLREPSRADRIRGGLWGLLVADALGVPYEFSRPEHLPPSDRIEPVPPPGFRRAHAGTPPGTWSDDGAQALCLLASLLDRGALDVDDLGARLLRWLDHGELAVDGRVFDVGNQTRTALEALRRGTPAVDAGPAGVWDNGNGSLMRVLPLALWHHSDDAELVRDARRQSLVTHRHLRSQLCCAAYVLWARRLLDGVDDAWGDAVGTLRAMLDPAELAELDEQVLVVGIPGGSGYVVDCLRSARWAAEQGSYEAAVRAAIGLGHDTDTTACVAGGIAGVRDGVGAIPARWLEALRGRELVEPLLERLLAHSEVA